MHHEESWSRYRDTRPQDVTIPAGATDQADVAVPKDAVEELERSSSHLPSAGRTSLVPV
jgi:hypothetical protein